MHLMLHFPSDTNESWFMDFIEDNFPELKSLMYKRNGEIVIIDYEHAREAIIEEARNLSAFITEGSDVRCTVL